MLLYEGFALNITILGLITNWILPFSFVYLLFKLTIYCALGGDVRCSLRALCKYMYAGSHSFLLLFHRSETRDTAFMCVCSTLCNNIFIDPVSGVSDKPSA